MTHSPLTEYSFSLELLRMRDPLFHLDYTRSFVPPLSLVRKETKEKAEEDGFIERYSR